MTTHTVATCPACGCKMRRITDDDGRQYILCLGCGAQIPIDDGYRYINRCHRKEGL